MLNFQKVEGDLLLVGSRKILRLQMGSMGAFEEMCQKCEQILILNAQYGLFRIFKKDGAVDFWLFFCLFML